MQRFFFTVLLMMFWMAGFSDSGPDSLWAGSPQADQYDSLFAAMMEPNESSFASVPYHFESDSVPAYPDSVYYERFEALNVLTPFDFKYNEEVRNYIIYFSSRRGVIGRALSRKDLYFPVFEQLLDKYHLPQELKYLAVVESALNPNARSHAGAVGLWQFMPGTGRLYGLKYNPRVDMRKDVYAATEAACRHFVDLYNVYHDWNLVLAAYNSGAGNVNKAIKRAGGQTDFWVIKDYLPRETRGYVPAFIAVNYLMNYPLEHNIQPVENQKNISRVLDTVYVHKKLYLKQVAQWLDIPYSQVRQWNPQYRRGYIPADKSHAYKLTLSLDKIADFVAMEKAILSGMSRKEYEARIQTVAEE